MEIELPPQEEQTAIAEALSDIDNLISSLQKLIEKKKAIKQGTMQELLTGKKRLPGFSGEWSKQQLGDICNIVNGGNTVNFNSRILEWKDFVVYADRILQAAQQSIFTLPRAKSQKAD